MNDYLQIKAINGQLTWNTSIIDLIEQTCFQINFEDNNIEVFLSRGEFVDGIEFIRAEIGRYELSTINNTYFNQISFDLITPEVEVRKVIQTWFDKRITVKLKNNKLTVLYDGNNSTIPSEKQLIISDKTLNINDIANWNSDIRNIRCLLKSEYRCYSYDFHYLITYNYGWLELKNIDFIGLKKHFRAYFEYNGEGITQIEAIIGNNLIEYEKTKQHIENIYGRPTEVESENDNSIYKNDVWHTDNVEIRLYSTYIPRSEPKLRYELKIKKL